MPWGCGHQKVLNGLRLCDHALSLWEYCSLSTSQQTLWVCKPGKA